MAELEFEIEEPDTGTGPEADALVRESFAAVDTAVLTRLVEHAFNRMRVSQSTYLSIAIVNEREMERIHLEWMDLPGPTDVMSFPMDELTPGTDTEPATGMLGDIVLCPDFANRQARKAGHGLGHELALLTVHGCLHLLGYDHITPAEEKEMFSLQNEILADWYDDLAARGVVYQPKPMNPGAFPTAAEREQLDQDMQEDSKTNPGTYAPGADGH